MKKLEPSTHPWWKCKMVQPLWQTLWQFLKKFKIHLPYNPAIILLEIYLREKEIRVYTMAYIAMFIGVFVVAKK